MQVRVPQSKQDTLRVLLLASRAEALASARQWPSDEPWLRLLTACGEPVDASASSSRCRHVLPTAVPWHQLPRTAAARTACAVLARRHGVDGAYLWAIKRDRWLRLTLRRVDAVVSLDAETDRALGLVPELLSEATVVGSRDVEQAMAGVRLGSEVLRFLRARVEERQWPTHRRRQRLTETELTVLDELVDTDTAAAVPAGLLPVTEMVDVLRHLSPAIGQAQLGEIVLGPLDRFRWEAAPGSDTSGMTAHRLGSRLLHASVESDLPDEQEMAEAVGAALRGADEALEAGHPALARGRLVDALWLMFHRERHAETPHSSLVADPSTFLAPLWSSRTFAEVRSGGQDPRVRPVAGEDGLPRVLVLAGAYGSFHGQVAAALAGEAVVAVRGPEIFGRFLNRRGLDLQFVQTLAQLRGVGPSSDEGDPWSAGRTSRRLLKALGPDLSRADVVFTDWADRLTVCASHLVPSGVRLVLRIHSLDALHPWFHLVDWRNVDQVLVVSEPLRVFVTQMLALVGSDVPVTVVPNLVAMEDPGGDKDPGARTTLGMIGWGRRVKDPLWALELLAREPSWRLVLVGHDLHQGQSRLAEVYNEQVRARLADPEIADRVDVVGWSDDVAAELRRIGVILSTSRRESWHVGLVQGAASGAVPVVRDWPVFRPVGGARALFPREWVVQDLDEAEARVRSVTEPSAWEGARHRAQQQARGLFDPEAAAARYIELILGPGGASGKRSDA